MKTTLFALIAFTTLGISSLSGLPFAIPTTDEFPSVGVGSPIAAIQESAPAIAPTVQDPPPPPSEESPSDMPAEAGSVVEWNSANEVYAEGAICCTCCIAPCCCEVPTTICLVDPCDGCSYEACVHLPPCCVGSAPVIEWKNGILGRKIIYLCWLCCDKQAKVVVPVIGDVRVWE